MSYNTKPIKTDVNQKPVPQYYNPVTDEYEVLQGKAGANRVLVYDIDGNPIDLVSLIASIVTAINTSGTTQLRAGTNSIGKVEVTSNALPTGASTASKQDQIKISIDNIYNKDTTKTIYGLSTDTKPTSGMVKGNVFFEINTGDVYMWNGTSWVVI